MSILLIDTLFSSPGEEEEGEEGSGEVPADSQQQEAKSKVRNTLFMLCSFLQVLSFVILVIIQSSETVLSTVRSPTHPPMQ